MMNYRDSERLRKAQYIMKNQCQYTDAEIRRAKKAICDLEGKS